MSETKRKRPKVDAKRPTREAAKTQVSQEVESTPPSSFDWMYKTHQWGTKARPSKKGLTLGSLNVGIYGEVPDRWDDETRLPRGGYPHEGIPSIGYRLRDKHSLWADNAADLYEEAIQRRWISATHIPWDTLTPLSDEVETAMCQLCTELSQHANTEVESISSWFQHMSFGYHEVKLFLATENADAGRHMEAFRKRALANGGGLGIEGRGEVNRIILESTGGWSEAALFLYLLRGTLTFILYRYGEVLAHNPAEKMLFRLCLQDKARHMAYGLEHLRYVIAHRPEKELVFHNLLNVGEPMLVRDLDDPVLPEAMAVIMGNGVKGAYSSMRRVKHMMGDFIRLYLRYTDWIGMPRRDKLDGGLAAYLED